MLLTMAAMRPMIKCTGAYAGGGRSRQVSVSGFRLEIYVMQCQLCDKPATVHLTEVTDGDRLERHLCEECAQNEGITISMELAPIKSVPVKELLSTLAAAQDEAHDLAGLQCPECQLRWVDFRKSGLLGCAADYEAFAEPLGRLIKQAQAGRHEHLGKTPKRLGPNVSARTTLRKLRHDLKEAVAGEDYEGAARLRDEIDKLTTE